MKHDGSDSYWGGIIKSMGLVFGDIGTSPIYTLTVIIALTKPTQENVFGIGRGDLDNVRLITRHVLKVGGEGAG